MKYIIDFDNTLVYTDEVNSFAYNKALVALGYMPLSFKGRITRKIVAEQFPEISKCDLEKIIILKQKIVIENILKIKCNEHLVEFIKSKGATNCILWTSTEKQRVQIILEKLNLFHLFSRIEYSDKKDIKRDIDWFVRIFKCNKNDMCFIEDNENVVEKITQNYVKVINIKEIYSVDDLLN